MATFLAEIFSFCSRYGLFSQTSTSDSLLIPNASARFLDNGLQMIEFLGRVVGKALYEGILLDYSFSHVFVQKLLGRYSFLDELSTLDPELYRSLMYVKVNPKRHIHAVASLINPLSKLIRTIHPQCITLLYARINVFKILHGLALFLDLQCSSFYS